MATLMSCPSPCVFCCISSNFCNWRLVRHPACGPWDHAPHYFWAAIYTLNALQATSSHVTFINTEQPVWCCSLGILYSFVL